MMNGKKSQLEILGLAIVVVVIILIMVFVIKFIIYKEPTDYVSSTRDTQLANNVVKTFLMTTTKCRGLNIEELLQDCAEDFNRVGDINCPGGMSCSYTKDIADLIFHRTLGEWNVTYRFYVYYDESDPIIESGGVCLAEKESEKYYIPTDLGTLYVAIDVC